MDIEEIGRTDRTLKNLPQRSLQHFRFQGIVTADNQRLRQDLPFAQVGNYSFTSAREPLRNI
ncbi:hypothetical protein [Nostoc sp.]